MNRKWLFVILFMSVLGIGSAGMGIVKMEDSIKAQQATPLLPTMETTNLDSQDANWFEKSEERSFEYLVHDGIYYVPIEEELNETNLDSKLGVVSRIGEWEEFREGDTPYYIPGSTYYTIKDVPDKNKIAIEIVRKESKKYQVLEKSHPVPK
ncbi:hypothetical protein FB479_102912 [Brevibacillus sp. AG162]|uniref:hypothetical protein n=1 Tax=Brevibacillus sp. AG162 TaxID=2572910 RepID=UPI001150B12B|nr:hypothetical protein [Brevibacillus sp. AG162]TQK74269.1 hypothetical protein FB479_102912 [Brevibacillus sp. AG162]